MDDLIAFLREQLASRKAMAVQAKRALDEWQRGNDRDDRWRLDEDGISINIKGEYVCVGTEVAVFLAVNDPDAVLADVDAKRQIVAEHEPILKTVEWPHDQTGKGEALVCPRCQNAENDSDAWRPAIGEAGKFPHEDFVTSYVLAPCRTLRLLSLPSATHPDYREEWKP